MAALTYEGKPCKRCQRTVRYKSNSQCVACNGRNLSPEKKAQATQRTLRWQRKNKDKVKAAQRARWHSTVRYRRYGITKDHFDLMLASQEGKCPGCAQVILGDSKTHIDHDHATGKVRGLLCQKCNQVLGMVEDSVETLLRLGVYLEAARG